LIGTVAANVLTHGTGALNIDASRIEGVPPSVPNPALNTVEPRAYNFATGKGRNGQMSQSSGRWPANILLDEEAAALLDEQSGVSVSPAPYRNTDSSGQSVFGVGGVSHDREFGDSGGASRFFYVAKASRSERNAGVDRLPKGRRAGLQGSDKDGLLDPLSEKWRTAPSGNIHPTVKPVDLMRYLIRLVTPKGGTVLDPFMGSGTTAVAAIGEGANWIGCEREPEYVAIIEARIAAAQPGMGLNLEEER
jgi:site-specific DNA-methyltransferase (adenine-specific)